MSSKQDKIESLENKITIDVISDVMCPWCFIGQNNLNAAVKLTSELAIEIRWRPYQLDATIPDEGKDRQQYLTDKFGGREATDKIYNNILQAGKECGIEFKFDIIKIAPNTLNAHRLIRWAGGINPERQHKLVNRLFEMFFLEGLDIGNHNVLIDAAKHVDLDVDIVADLLKGDRDIDAVKSEIAQARQMGINGVPFYIIANKYAINGAQSPQMLANAMRQAAAEIKEENEFNTKT